MVFVSKSAALLSAIASGLLLLSADVEINAAAAGSSKSKINHDINKNDNDFQKLKKEKEDSSFSHSFNSHLVKKNHEKDTKEEMLDNYLKVKKGPCANIEAFEAKGNFNETMTLFKSKVVKSEFACSSVSRPSVTNKASIQTTITNPYHHNLTVVYDISSTTDGVGGDSDGFYIVPPGESILIGDVVRVRDDDPNSVDNDKSDGAIYIVEDGSYFSVFGAQTILSVTEDLDFIDVSGYNCGVTGSFMSVIGHNDELQITQSITKKEKEEKETAEKLKTEELSKNQKLQTKSIKQEKKTLKLLENLKNNGQMDNYIEKKLGGHKDPVDFFEAKGYLGDKMTLFESKVMKAEFNCSQYSDDIRSGISMTITNPYDYNLTVIYDIATANNSPNPKDGDDILRLQPGESLFIGSVVREDTSNDDPIDVDNDNSDGVVYIVEDGSYFSVFGSQTVIATATDVSLTGYNCIVSGPFIGITGYKDSLRVTKNAKMVKDLPKQEKYHQDPETFEMEKQKQIVKHEEVLSKKKPEKENEKTDDGSFINHYIGSTFGTYVFEAKGNIGDTMTLFESKVMKAEFTCLMEPKTADDTILYNAIAMTITNVYDYNLTVVYDIAEKDGFLIVQPGESIPIGNVVDHASDDDSVNNDSGDGVVYIVEDGSYFSVFGSQTIFATSENEEIPKLTGYNCIVSGPYLAGLPRHDILKNTNSRPVTDNKNTKKLNNLFSKKNNNQISNEKMTLKLDKLYKKSLYSKSKPKSG